MNQQKQRNRTATKLLSSSDPHQLTFCLAHILTWFLILASFFLSHVYIYIYILTFHLACILTFYLAFFLAFDQSDICSDILSEILSGNLFGIYSGILWHGFGSRWAPSTASEPCDPQSWRDGRDGDGEEEEGRGRRKEEEGVAPLLKSSDPHLPGQVGKNMEKYSLQVISTNRHFIQHIFWDSIGILTFLTDIYLFFWDTFWQIFWRSTWHSAWHLFWHFLLILTYTPTFYLAYSDIVSDIYNLLGICPTMSDQSLEFYPTRT